MTGGASADLRSALSAVSDRTRVRLQTRTSGLLRSRKGGDQRASPVRLSLLEEALELLRALHRRRRGARSRFDGPRRLFAGEAASSVNFRGAQPKVG